MKRFAGWLGFVATWAMPVLKIVNTIIGLGGLPSDLATWKHLLTTVVGGFTVLDYVLLVVGLICLWFAAGGKRPALRRQSDAPPKEREPLPHELDQVPAHARGSGMYVGPGSDVTMIGGKLEGNAGHGIASYGTVRTWGADIRDNGASGPGDAHQQLVEQLRALRGSDSLPYFCHVEFLSSAQRPKAERLRDVFELAGWDINFGSVPHDRYTQRHATGIEVKAVNGRIGHRVAQLLNLSGEGPANPLPESTQIKRDNPKWAMVQRTVCLFIGYPPE